MPLAELLPLGPGTAQWAVWGTTARLVVTDPAHLGAARALVCEHLAAVDAACSRFRPDSELERLQRAGGRGPVSPLLADLVRTALDAAAASGGDVDPTLGDAIAALGYDRDLADVHRTEAAGVEVTVRERVRTDWRRVELTVPVGPAGGTGPAHLTVPTTARLDLGATAKARAADVAAARVAAALPTGVLVALGGDLATAGPAPDGGWTVLVQDGPDEPADVVVLPAGTALATSSTLSRRWRAGTRAMHHVLDPRRLVPAPTVWRTASVAAPTCVAANTATTAALVRGTAATGPLLADARPARLVRADGEVLRLGGWPPAPGGARAPGAAS